MTLLTGAMLLLAGIFFWSGFRAKPHALQYQSRAGFFGFVMLSGLSGYFAWRESRVMADLARYIDPVPGVTSTTYVPTPAEQSAVAELTAGVPVEGRFGTSPEARRELAETLSGGSTEYWILHSSLATDSVFAFYRTIAPLRGWVIATDEPPWLMLQKGVNQLSLFVTPDVPGPGVSVLYSLTRPSR